MGIGGERTEPEKTHEVPAIFFVFPAPRAAIDDREGPGSDGGARPVLLAPVPCPTMAGESFY
ncbi:hypothetical protein GBA52_013012 [Prunus armeniaca]|nr:hypothetical protein GBA52_013012 [Prunus armeniaca]